MNRLIAYGFDWFIVSLVIGLIYGNNISNSGVSGIWMVIIPFLYFYIEAAIGCGIGKFIFRLHTAIYGVGLTRHIRCLIRSSFKVVSVIPFVHWAFLLSYINNSFGNSWIDKISHSRVLDMHGQTVPLTKDGRISNVIASIFIPPAIVIVLLGLVLGNEINRSILNKSNNIELE